MKWNAVLSTQRYTVPHNTVQYNTVLYNACTLSPEKLGDSRDLDLREICETSTSSQSSFLEVSHSDHIVTSQRVCAAMSQVASRKSQVTCH